MDIKYKLRNFWAFGNQLVEIDLTTKGLTLIRGKHLTSTAKSTNAVGKTTLLHGLIWLLYGKYPPKAVKALVTNSTTGKNCYGEIEIGFRGKQAKIYRGIDHDEITTEDITVVGDFLLFFLDGQDVRGATDTDTQKNIEEFLGLDYESFVTAALFTTTDDAFSSQTSSKQDKILTTLLHLEDLETARQKVLARQKEVRFEIEELDDKRLQKETLRDSYEQQVEEWKSTIDVWKQEKAAKRKNLKSKVTALEEEIEDCEDSIEDADECLKEIVKQLAVHEVQDYEERLITLEDNQDVHTQRMEELNLEYGKVQGKIGDLQEEIAGLQGLDGVATCPTCEQDLPEEHLYSHIKDKNERLDLKVKQETELEVERSEVREELASINADSRKLRSDQNEFTKLKSDRQRNKNSIQASNELIEEKQRAIQSYLRGLETLDREESPQQKNTVETERKIEKLKTELTELSDNRVKLLTLLDDLDFCETMFGPSGIRNYLIRSTIPKLNQDANRFADILTNGELTVTFSGEKEVGKGKKKAVRNKLQVKVEDQYGSDKYESCSGGEKRRVDICVNLALNYLVASRVGLPFVFMDEIFLSLDNRGKTKVIELLRVISDEIPSVFVISNQDDIANEEFDNIWTVYREDKSSWMEVS